MQDHYTTRPLAARLERALEAGLDKSGPCWIWTRGKDGDGYGVLSGHDGGKPYWLRAHRVAYELIHGPIPVGHVVCHHCDVPACCNPAHLFTGTHADNVRDRDAKGRARKAGRHGGEVRGEQVNTARLRASDIPVIRGRARKEPYADIARDYGISVSAVACVARRVTWTHIPAGPDEPVGGRDTRLRPALSAEQSATVVALYQAAPVPLCDLAARFGVSEMTIKRILQRAGVALSVRGRRP